MEVISKTKVCNTLYVIELIRKVILITSILMGFSVMTFPSLAQTPSDPKLTLPFQKFKITTIADLVEKKCERLTNIAGAAVKRARVRYKDDLNAAGLSDEVMEFEKQVIAGLNTTSCAQLISLPAAITALQYAPAFVDEYLLAILRSGIVTCGDDFDVVKISAIITRAEEAEIRLKARPDYADVNTFAQSAGQEFLETCLHPIVSSADMIWADPIGEVFFHAYFELK